MTVSIEKILLPERKFDCAYLLKGLKEVVRFFFTFFILLFNNVVSLLDEYFWFKSFMSMAKPPWKYFLFQFFKRFSFTFNKSLVRNSLALLLYTYANYFNEEGHSVFSWGERNQMFLIRWQFILLSRLNYLVNVVWFIALYNEFRTVCWI